MKIAQRVHLAQVFEDADYEHLAEFLEKHKTCIDEVTLFTGFCHHGAIPMDELRPQAEVLLKRIEDLKKRGFKSVGLNVHTTFGHIDEGYVCYGQPFTPMVGYRGDTALACFCPEHEDMKQFLREKYTMYAKTNPDFIWVDDDVKYFWNGVKFGCFCPACMERFNKKTGTDYTREQLIEAMEKPDAVEIRAAWVQDIGSRITELFSMIERCVHEVDPDIKLGFQTQHQGWSTYNTMDYQAWMPALGANMARPGEGFYDDKTPVNVCTKALSCARQAAEYPKCITDVQYEIEDFPNYSLLQKSIRINLDEFALAAAQGLNGVLVNSLYPNGEMTGKELDPLYEAIAQNRSDWDKMEQYAKGLTGVGFYPAVSSKYDQRRPLHNGQSFFITYDEAPNHNVMQTYSLCHVGVPLTMDVKNAYGAVFVGDLPDGYTKEELLEFLKKSVIVDHTALKAFERRGLGKYFGVRTTGEEIHDSVAEYYTDCEYNRGFEHVARDVHPAFYGGGACLLEAVRPGVIPLSVLKDPKFRELGLGAALYENELGGRVCVFGYAAYQKIDSLGKLVQIRNVERFLTKNRELTCFIEPCLAAQFVRSNGKRTMATIINLSLDTLNNEHFSIRGAQKARLLKNGTESYITADADGLFSLPTLLPFETCTLLTE